VGDRVGRDPAEHAEVMAEMALSLHDVESFSATVDRVLEFALKALNCAYAGVIVVHEGRRVETVVATHPVVADLDRIQMECGDGPDLEVIADRHGVLVRDVSQETRWPAWCRQVADTGIRSMLGTRLYTTTNVIGSLNVYDVEVDKFAPEDVDVAHMLARHAAVAMDRAREQEHLWRAIDARNLIGQAQGILMERFSVDADQAFAVLRRYSQDHNLKLHAVAQRLIESGSLPDD
jgi:GAF domain-containing protein